MKALFLLVLFTAGSSAAAQKCRLYKTFCERWMCQQNKAAGSPIYPIDECKMERPPSLVSSGKLAVQAMSVALVQTGVEKTAKANSLYDEGKAVCGSGGTPVHPCICDASIDRSQCEKSIKRDVFSNDKSPYFQNQYFDLFAGRFIQNNALQSANLGIPTPPQEEATLNCIQRYGEAACGAVSPAAKRRRQLRSRVLAEKFKSISE